MKKKQTIITPSVDSLQDGVKVWIEKCTLINDDRAPRWDLKFDIVHKPYHLQCVIGEPYRYSVKQWNTFLDHSGTGARDMNFDFNPAGGCGRLIRYGPEITIECASDNFNVVLTFPWEQVGAGLRGAISLAQENQYYFER